ncbi:peptidylprolyl isomerase [Yoonia sediminilitoris]|uniref:Parvulin-like PPIase n=1 Tax=Yoonia sediminilitoris TaxID=1286148 RepID=A0A2T6KLT9_9RHOB|nr:peptidylprolyl isomerase [Yoonia sediminilitoris]PUB17127.1 peptidyl-prolyl cis-trans isomerase C [Yoonia sediminilitoris]RCW97422.1 peptidyl-prolyl cis-trans isomerase C [Yoonia sediminilitoris]
MLKHVTILGSAILGLGLSTSAFAQELTADTVVATVNDTEITVGHIIIARSQLPPQYNQFPNEALFDGLVEQLIQQQLLAEAADNPPAGLRFTIENEQRSLLAGETINALSAEAVTEEAVRAAYDARFEDVEAVTQFNASHLLVATQEEAAAAKTRIDGGQAFADVARDVSTGPTGPNGGNLGWFGAGAMVPEFETTITALEIGAVSEPFETQFGWHVATLNEVREEPRPTIEELGQELASELQEVAITAKLEELAANATVIKPGPNDFDINLIDMIELLE